MKLDKNKFQIALARACMTNIELREKTLVSRSAFNSAIQGQSARPATLGKIARALGVDVIEILAKEEQE